MAKKQIFGQLWLSQRLVVWVVKLPLLAELFLVCLGNSCRKTSIKRTMETINQKCFKSFLKIKTTRDINSSGLRREFAFVYLPLSLFAQVCATLFLFLCICYELKNESKNIWCKKHRYWVTCCCNLFTANKKIKYLNMQPELNCPFVSLPYDEWPNEQHCNLKSYYVFY